MTPRIRHNRHVKYWQHPGFLRVAVAGADDGLITTFAVVAAVAGAGFSPQVVISLGMANLIADGVSMGIGDYLGEKSEAERLSALTKQPIAPGLWLLGVTTFIAFACGGIIPLLPYLVRLIGVTLPSESEFLFSAVATAIGLVLVGIGQSFFTKKMWWRSALEVLFMGTIAATVAYAVGLLIEKIS